MLIATISPRATFYARYCYIFRRIYLNDGSTPQGNLPVPHSYSANHTRVASIIENQFPVTGAYHESSLALCFSTSIPRSGWDASRSRHTLLYLISKLYLVVNNQVRTYNFRPRYPSVLRWP